MEKKSLMKTIEDVALEVLQKQGAADPSKSVLLPTIVEKFKEIQPGVNDSTLSAYLSKLARDGGSRIKSAGKKKGFYFDETPAKVETSKAALVGGDSGGTISIRPQDQAGEKEGRSLIEKKLYSFMKEWLVAEGYNADVTANKTSNGKWGNPDITGIKVTETVSESKEVEIITVEVKPDLTDWKQFIFEAVSHTRFANLSYYCFAHEEHYSVPAELFLYAEEFGLGLIGIEMEQDDYRKYLEGSYDPKFEDVEIIELQTPRLKMLRPFFREKFLKSLGIESLKDLILWAARSEPLKHAS